MDGEYSIHEQAAANFDGKGALGRAALGPVSPAPTPQGGWRPDTHMTHVHDSDIKSMRIREYYPVAAIWEDRDGKRVGLTGEAATNFLELAEQVWRAIKPKGTVSKARIVDLACDWLFGNNPAVGLTEYCLNAISAEAKPYRVWVPISGLHVQDSFEVGTVTFEELTATRIELWHKSEGYAGLNDREREAVDGYYAEFAKKHKGHAVAWTELTADKEQATIIALERVEDALAMVRFFSGGALLPSSRSICTPSGRERSECYNVVFDHNGTFAGASRGALDGERARPWGISRAELSELMKAGLAALSELLRCSELSGFQERVLASVKLFSEAALEGRLQVKLVLVLSAIEGVYLGNRGEPIQQNVGERLALLTEQGPEARLALTKLVREVYDARSKFVHHAERVESTDSLRAFFRSAWLGVIRAIEHAGTYATVKDFTDAIDLQKFR